MFPYIHILSYRYNKLNNALT